MFLHSIIANFQRKLHGHIDRYKHTDRNISISSGITSVKNSCSPCLELALRTLTATASPVGMIAL